MSRKSKIIIIVVAFFLLGAVACDPTVLPETMTSSNSTDANAEVTDFGQVVIVSTQGVPSEEAERIETVLADFPGQPMFEGVEEPDLLARVRDQARARTGEIDLIITVHGNYPSLVEAEALADLTEIRLDLFSRGIPRGFFLLGQLGQNRQHYIPLMQATYIFAANKTAFDYLPPETDPQKLSWVEFQTWAENMAAASGKAQVGFPAGDDGLMHRFLQGYIYPAYTGGMVTGFQSEEAVIMWEDMQAMWRHVEPQSENYAFMQDPLLTEEVWVAFDHTARLRDVFEQRPDDFVALPAPTGPKGLGFIPVIIGASIPTNAPNPEGAQAMIKYLLQDDVQINILRELGFFPVVELDYPDSVSPGIQLEAEAVARQAGSPNAIPALIPVGLDERGGEINQIYRHTFRRIVIEEEDIATVLAEEGERLQTLLDETGAPCWSPDPPSRGTCQVAIPTKK